MSQPMSRRCGVISFLRMRVQYSIPNVVDSLFYRKGCDEILKSHVSCRVTIGVLLALRREETSRAARAVARVGPCRVLGVLIAYLRTSGVARNSSGVIS